MMFKEIDPFQLETRPFSKIGKEWMLILAGSNREFNMMTASWGALGTLWEKPVAFCFIRPSRYTFQFVEKNTYFSLCFFPSHLRPILDYCGSISGRQENKTEKTGLTVISDETGGIYFQQADLALICRKLYYQDLQPENFLSGEILEFYEHDDYHRMFVGEVVKCLVKNK